MNTVEEKMLMMMIEPARPKKKNIVDVVKKIGQTNGYIKKIGQTNGYIRRMGA